MLSLCEITDIFYLCDEFSIEFNRMLPKRMLKEDNGKNIGIKLSVYQIVK